MSGVREIDAQLATSLCSLDTNSAVCSITNSCGTSNFRNLTHPIDPLSYRKLGKMTDRSQLQTNKKEHRTIKEKRAITYQVGT